MGTATHSAPRPRAGSCRHVRAHEPDPLLLVDDALGAAAMISVAIVDDHPAVPIGLQAALRAEPGLVPIGCAGDAAELEPLLYRSRPDVVLLDYQLPGVNGLALCRRIKSDVPAPAVLIYSAFADESLTIPAIVAGADGVVHKAHAPRRLYEALRTVARGGRALPPVSQDLVRAAFERVAPDDLPILGMLLDHATPGDVATALRLRPRELDERLSGMLDRLRAHVPAAARP